MGGDSRAGRQVQGSRSAWTQNHMVALRIRQSTAIKWAGINTGWLDRVTEGHVYWWVRMSDGGEVQGHLVDEWRMARTERFHGNTQSIPWHSCLPCSSGYFPCSLYFLGHVLISPISYLLSLYCYRNRQRELWWPRDSSLWNKRGGQLFKWRDPEIWVPVWLRAHWRENHILPRQQSVVGKHPHLYM